MIEVGYAWHYKQFANEQLDQDRIAYAEARCEFGHKMKFVGPNNIFNPLTPTLVVDK